MVDWLRKRVDPHTQDRDGLLRVAAIVSLSLAVLWVGAVWALGATRATRQAASTAFDVASSIVNDPDVSTQVPSTLPATPAILPDDLLSSTTEAPAPSTTAAPAPTAAPASAAASKFGAFKGMGTWVDVFDWSPTYAKGRPPGLGPEAVDVMAAQGVQTIYIQAARADWTGGGDIVDLGTLKHWLDRAKAKNVAIVPWYLPTFKDVHADYRRILAIANLPTVTSFGVDIEDTHGVENDAERSKLLTILSQYVRAALPGKVISAITLPNVVTDIINTSYWPGFPWKQIAPFYDIWQPMSYWTNRTAASGWRDAAKYTGENIRLMRSQLGLPSAPVHPIGGIGDETTAADVVGFHAASKAAGAIGGSLYDWRTQKPESYGPMRAFVSR